MINVDSWSKFPTQCSEYQRSWLDIACRRTVKTRLVTTESLLIPTPKNRKYLRKILENFDHEEKIVLHDVINITIAKHPYEKRNPLTTAELLSEEGELPQIAGITY